MSPELTPNEEAKLAEMIETQIDFWVEQKNQEEDQD